MRERTIMVHLFMAGLAFASAGCWSVAASITGGALLGVGMYAARDTAEEVVPLPLNVMEELARDTLKTLDVDVVNVEHNQSDGSTTACHFEACLVGDKVTSVDVVLERLSDKMTSVSVTARRGWASPQLETAGEILARIVAAGHKACGHATRSSGDPI
ncbi:MAG: hypothetical protein ABIF82_09325 [Planctomycetota bacterium]